MKNEGWEEHPYEGFSYLVKSDAGATTVQDKPTTEDYLPDRVQLRQEAAVIQGVPFVRVEEVVACKRSYGRPKDCTNITSLEKYIQEHAGQDL